jgi:hypothetical protein
MRAEQYRDFQVPFLIEAVPLEHAADAQCNLPVGAHLNTPRRGYLHHGIYLGDGNVVHYPGSTRGLHRGPVEEIPLDRFTCGYTVWVLCRTPHHFDPREVIRHARSRVGENHYRVFSNNCEHFCEWCLHGEHRSYQVEALLSLPVRALKATLRLIASLVSEWIEHDTALVYSGIEVAEAVSRRREPHSEFMSPSCGGRSGKCARVSGQL